MGAGELYVHSMRYEHSYDSDDFAITTYDEEATTWTAA